jgi:hypothetical protein
MIKIPSVDTIDPLHALFHVALHSAFLELLQTEALALVLLERVRKCCNKLENEVDKRLQKPARKGLKGRSVAQHNR